MKKVKKLDALLKMANEEDVITKKMANMKRAHTAKDPDEILKVAESMSVEEYSKLTPGMVQKVSNWVQEATDMKKQALNTPGLPSETAPSEVDIPAQTTPTQKEEKLPEGKTDPAINLEGSPPVPQAPGTSPTEVDIPKELPASEKTAFVFRSLGEGINMGKDLLIKAATAKLQKQAGNEKMVKDAETAIKELIEEYGEDKVAAFLDASAKEGFESARQTINGGENV